MKTFDCCNINEAYDSVLGELLEDHIIENPREHVVMAFKEPICIKITRPEQVCLFNKSRLINPFFILFEGLWIMSGREDLASIKLYNKNISQFAENDGIFWGAYGNRLHHSFNVNQFDGIIKTLKNDIYSRHAVMTIWNPSLDCGTENKKDIPCNCLVNFRVRDKIYLDMTVYNRSNDLIWGQFGTDIPQFGTILTYFATQLDLVEGNYYHISQNTHVYINQEAAEIAINGYLQQERSEDLYGFNVKPVPKKYFADVNFLRKLDAFFDVAKNCQEININFGNLFIDDIAIPIHNAWIKHKAYLNWKKNYSNNKETSIMQPVKINCKEDVADFDWIFAAQNWLSVKEVNEWLF